MSQLVHTARMKIVQEERPNRRLFLDGFPEPIRFGVHTKIAAFYNMTPKEELPSTLDHMIGAVGG